MSHLYCVMIVHLQGGKKLSVEGIFRKIYVNVPQRSVYLVWRLSVTDLSLRIQSNASQFRKKKSAELLFGMVVFYIRLLGFFFRHENVQIVELGTHIRGLNEQKRVFI